jgi:hypothetical protein
MGAEFHGAAPRENGFFHSVENIFPLCGKTAKHFSIVWKNGETFFHCVEKTG